MPNKLNYVPIREIQLKATYLHVVASIAGYSWIEFSEWLQWIVVSPSVIICVLRLMNVF